MAKVAKKPMAKKVVAKTGAPTKAEPKRSSTSLVLGILSLLFCWIPVVGLVLPIIGISTRKWDETGMGTAGLVTSIIGLCFSALYHFFWAFMTIGLIASIATGHFPPSV